MSEIILYNERNSVSLKKTAALQQQSKKPLIYNFYSLTVNRIQNYNVRKITSHKSNTANQDFEMDRAHESWNEDRNCHFGRVSVQVADSGARPIECPTTAHVFANLYVQGAIKLTQCLRRKRTKPPANCSDELQRIYDRGSKPLIFSSLGWRTARRP